MANLLGDCWQSGEPDVGACFCCSWCAGLHLYGKARAKARPKDGPHYSDSQHNGRSQGVGASGTAGCRYSVSKKLRQKLGSLRLQRTTFPRCFDSQYAAAQGKPLHCQEHAHSERMKADTASRLPETTKRHDSREIAQRESGRVFQSS